jgi:hypothetical protein
MTTTLTIQAMDFSDYETRLVQEQLRVVASRTRYSWRFDGEGCSAYLILARKPCKVAAHSVTALCDESIEKMVIHPHLPRTLLCEWPMRLMNLLDILQMAEDMYVPEKHVMQDSQVPFSADDIKKRVLGLQPGEMLKIQLKTDSLQSTAYIDGNNHQTSVYLPGEAALFVEQMLVGDGYDLEIIPRTQNARSGDPVPLQSFLWKVVLREPVSALEQQQWQGFTFKLLTWPLFGILKTEPYMLRLAALFTKGHHSITDAAQLAQTTADHVIRFLKACRIVDIKMEKAVVSPDRVNRAVVVNQQADRQRSLLVSLRKKLGLVFK